MSGLRNGHLRIAAPAREFGRKADVGSRTPKPDINSENESKEKKQDRSAPGALRDVGWQSRLGGA